MWSVMEHLFQARYVVELKSGLLEKEHQAHEASLKLWEVERDELKGHILTKEWGRVDAEVKLAEAKAKKVGLEAGAAEAKARAIEQYLAMEEYREALKNSTFAYYQPGYRRKLRKGFAQGFK